MELVTILTFSVIGGLIWGGFVFFLISAIKFETKKSNNE